MKVSMLLFTVTVCTSPALEQQNNHILSFILPYKINQARLPGAGKCQALSNFSLTTSEGSPRDTGLFMCGTLHGVFC
jgi:hypothetical protein